MKTTERFGANLDAMSRGMGEAMLKRMGDPTPQSETGLMYRGMTLIEMFRLWAISHGISTRGMDKMQVAGLMLSQRDAGGSMTTGDFGGVLAAVMNKRLRMGYDENPGTYTRWARRAPNAPDFKTLTVVQLSSMPDLLRVNEHGEFKIGTLSDGKETYQLLTYGRIVAFTRQMIVNDDLRAFDRAITAFGAAAARLENRTVYAQLTSNPLLINDGLAVFHATHANLASGGASALQASALATARTAMRLQRGLQSEELNLAPSKLIVPAALETTAYQLTSPQFVPATAAAINEFRTGGRTALEPIVEPILDAISSTAWYLAAENSQVDTVEYCFLDGADGPFIEVKNSFEVDGLSVKCRHDFAAKVLDYRGLYKSVGV